MSCSKLTLVDSAGNKHPVNKAPWCKFVTIKNITDDTDDTEGSEIPLSNVTSDLVPYLNQWVEKHVDTEFPEPEKNVPKNSDITDEWDVEYLKQFPNNEVLFALILAVNFLDCKPFLDLLCKHVASKIKGKSPEEIRTIFNIVNDFTPEEEEQVRKENAWCEEK